jgi:hypothetical protein
VVAHHKKLGVRLSQGLFVELGGAFVKPPGPRFLVVAESKPNVAELTDLGVVLAPTEVNNVSDSQGLELSDMMLGRYRTSECEPGAYKERLHRLGRRCIPDRPRRLQNLYLPNAIIAPFVPAL